MIVMKFGGSSVSTAAAMLNIKKIVETASKPSIVVVSAIGGVTDRLIATAAQAAGGDPRYRYSFNEIVDDHHHIIEAVLEPSEKRTRLIKAVNELLEDLRSILHGVELVGELTSRSNDAIVSYGERIASLIVACLIDGAVHVEATKVVMTQKDKHKPQGGSKQKNVVNFTETNARIHATFAGLTGTAVIGGFIASDTDTGEVTNIGRGGSDYTASIIAAAIGASRLEIWTDIDGFMTADPKLVPSASTISELTYTEATELCNFGARVLYPPTIFPAFVHSIPIYIKNTFRPELPGSIIHKEAKPNHHPVRGMSSIADISMVTVSGLSMVGVIGVNRRIFSTLADSGVSVFLVVQTASETSTSLCVKKEDAERACAAIDTAFASEIANGSMYPAQRADRLATIAVVGEGMKHVTGIVGKLFGVLGQNGINITAMAQGANETNISLVMDQDRLRKALNVIHDSFFLSDYKVINLYVCGDNELSRELLSMIEERRESMTREQGLRINVVGVIGGERAAFCQEGLDLRRYEEEMKPDVLHGVGHLMHRIITDNLSNAVFVDCTADKSVSHIYANLFESNISVVTANKYAASASYEHYARLKETAATRGVHFMFETNVGANLPILRNIDMLAHSGDSVTAFQALVSSPYNFALASMSAEIPFSKSLRKAFDIGLCEENVCLDACGMDMLRKIVIMARECGYVVEKKDIDWKCPVPKSMCELSEEDFWERLTEYDEEFEHKRMEAAREGHKLCFMAEWRNDNGIGRGSIALRELNADHPLYHVNGTNSAVLLYTKCYGSTPMLLQGYGAGKKDTAAGLLGDISAMA